MGFLKGFFRNVFRDGALPNGGSSFANVSNPALEAHLAVARYGEFILPDAVRPSYDLKVIPQQGFRRERYVDPADKSSIPVLMSSVSRESLFETFIDLLDLLGPSVDVVLETSHNHKGGHTDLHREHIDLPVLKSYLYDFEEMLTNDGCTGIAVMNPKVPFEVQFDEHKLLLVYGHELEKFEKVFISRGIRRNDSMQFLTEAEHVHSSKESYLDKFLELQSRLGMDNNVNSDEWRTENRNL